MRSAADPAAGQDSTMGGWNRCAAKIVNQKIFENTQPPGLTDDLGAYLHYMVAMEGSDLFLTTGAVPTA
jgi:hypothetical protein